MPDPPTNRANFELVQIDADEYHVIARDGTIAGRISAADADRLQAIIDDPLAYSREIERRLARGD